MEIFGTMKPPNPKALTPRKCYRPRMKARSAEPPFTISPVGSLRVFMPQKPVCDYHNKQPARSSLARASTARITEDFGARQRNSLGSSRLGLATLFLEVFGSKAEVASAP